MLKEFSSTKELMDPHIVDIDAESDRIGYIDWDSRLEALRGLSGKQALEIPLAWRESNPALVFFDDNDPEDVSKETFEEWMAMWPTMDVNHLAYEWITIKLGAPTARTQVSISSSMGYGFDGPFLSVAKYLAFLLITDLKATQIRVTYTTSGSPTFEYEQDGHGQP